MQTVYIESQDELPERGDFILPEFSRYKVHYRASVWAYLHSTTGGDYVLSGNVEFRLKNDWRVRK